MCEGRWNSVKDRGYIPRLFVEKYFCWEGRKFNNNTERLVNTVYKYNLDTE